MADAHLRLRRRHGHGGGAARQPHGPLGRIAARLHRRTPHLHPAEHRRLLHRGRGDPHGAAGARSRPVELGQARGDRRRAHALSRQRRAARGDARAGGRGLRRAALHQRRSGDLPQARGRWRRGGDAARRADRIGPGHPEPEQHADHPRAGARAGDRRCRRRHGVRRGDRDGARRRRRADEHRDRAGAGSGRDGHGDEAGGRSRTAGVSRRPHPAPHATPPPAARRRPAAAGRRRPPRPGS